MIQGQHGKHSKVERNLCGKKESRGFLILLRGSESKIEKTNVGTMFAVVAIAAIVSFLIRCPSQHAVIVSPVFEN